MNLTKLYQPLLEALENTDLAALGEAIPQMLERGLSTERYGDLASWLKALEAMPEIGECDYDLGSSVTIKSPTGATSDQLEAIDQCLRALIPWRKGPFQVCDTYIDTEWRSDWKWERVLPHLEPLKNRTVLDVGCGSGYHCWRMHGAGATRVIGIDPSPRFIVQFAMIKHFLPELPVDVLPTTLEALPANLKAFDTTFSMGVLYHRRSPFDHLRELRETLTPGGQLVLETLVVDGPLGHTLVPEGRYAMMNNVWFLPSVATLSSWLAKVGFTNIRVVDINETSFEEQRTTQWMRFHSLEQFLDPADPSKTREGHPRPKRAVLVGSN